MRIPLTTTPAGQWARRHPVLSVFVLGLLIRVVGGLLIWAADGHPNLLAKAGVIVGVALSVFGIGVLKWLSMRPRQVLKTAAEPQSSSGRAAALCLFCPGVS